MPERDALLARPGLRAGLGCLVVLFACLPTSADANDAIQWRSDFERARAEARAKDLPIWVQFTGPWCHFCRMMDREAFIHPEVAAAANEQFVPVKLQSEDNEALALSLELSALPSTVIVRPDGSVVARHEGYAEPGAFLAFLDHALGRLGRSRKAVGPRTGAEAAGPAPRSQDGIALAGYCPVTLVEGHRLEAGQAEVTAKYDGREYRFASESVRDAFLKEPERFLPASGGQCPVNLVDRGQRVAGNPKFGVLYRGRLFLCGDESTRTRFLKQPERYCNADLADQGFCPHCRGQHGRLVRGSPRYVTTHAGRRYLFPDADHLEAFRASPDKYLR